MLMLIASALPTIMQQKICLARLSITEKYFYQTKRIINGSKSKPRLISLKKNQLLMKWGSNKSRLAANTLSGFMIELPATLGNIEIWSYLCWQCLKERYLSYQLYPVLALVPMTDIEIMSSEQEQNSISLLRIMLRKLQNANATIMTIGIKY